MKRSLSWTFSVLIAIFALGWWLSRAATPDAFYAAPVMIPTEPGVLLRQEPFERYVPANARGWRILYTTTRSDGSPALGSAIVMVPKSPATESRPVLAWTHGTSGIVTGCAPSMLDLDPARYLPAWNMAPAQGWIFVAPDYAGLGTAGRHEYLIGEGEARSTLDAVRAARNIDGIRASDRTVVWGHSQGGHASLWTGIVAPAYAPDVPVAGVGGVAPATDLVAIVEDIHETVIGRFLTALVLRAYANAYSDVGFDDYVRPIAAPIARDMANRCATPAASVFSAVEGLAIGGSIFRTPPTSGALGRRLAQNIPDRPMTMPLMIAQGTADDVVAAPIQTAFVKRRCAAGQSMTYVRYAGRDHMGVTAPGSPLEQDLLRWTRDRFAGVPAPVGCQIIER
jgi:alpha-beta hydrolase superfamily lysophospholipase